MGGTGVIDHFLEVFTRYIDSGFGLLGGGFRPPDARGLFAVIEPGENRAF